MGDTPPSFLKYYNCRMYLNPESLQPATPEQIAKAKEKIEKFLSSNGDKPLSTIEIISRASLSTNSPKIPNANTMARAFIDLNESLMSVIISQDLIRKKILTDNQGIRTDLDSKII